MPESAREVWITGIGIVSCLGEGLDAHWDALEAGRTVVDTESFKPYVVHPLAALDLDKQIPKKGDQRQMEPWQRIGTYAAGLALENAGLKGSADILSRTDLIVSARGGERDDAVDSAVLTGLMRGNAPPTFLNERLMNDLRPTLFLAQLSNLLAGNISIVHGVTGSSRTVMGEETAGADAVRIAAARIASGTSNLVLVGGACNANRKDQIMHFELRGFAWQGEPRGIWDRGEKGGFAFGSAGAFLVVEAAEHARARGAKPYARLGPVRTSWQRRSPGTVSESLGRMLADLAPKPDLSSMAVISGASGVGAPTGEERNLLSKHEGLAVRATGTHLGHAMEAQFLVGLSVAALSLARKKLYTGSDTSGFERPFTGELRRAIVTGVGHWRGEGAALVEAVD